MRFQQLTGAVMAKGVEDTAFYRWTRFVALNEVGGDPARFGVDAGRSSTRRADAPAAALAGRHDHAVHPRHQARRGRPGPARRARRAARRLDRGGARAGCAPRRCPTRRSPTCSGRPSVGAWPIERERLQAYVEKAAREAATSHDLGRTRTSAFETALHAVVDRIYDDPALQRRGRRRSPPRSRRPAGPTRSGQKLVQLDHARRAGRLPGHRAVGHLAGRPGQPPAGRLRRRGASCWPGSTAAGGRRSTQTGAAKLLVVSRDAAAAPASGRSCSPATGRCRRRPGGRARAGLRPRRRDRRGDPAAGRTVARRRLARHHPVTSPVTMLHGPSFTGTRSTVAAGCRWPTCCDRYPVALLASHDAMEAP